MEKLHLVKICKILTDKSNLIFLTIFIAGI